MSLALAVFDTCQTSSDETVQRVKGTSPAVFEINTPGRVFYIEADNIDEMERWTSALNLSIQRYARTVETNKLTVL